MKDIAGSVICTMRLLVVLHVLQVFHNLFIGGSECMKVVFTVLWVL